MDTKNIKCKTCKRTDCNYVGTDVPVWTECPLKRTWCDVDWDEVNEMQKETDVFEGTE